VNRAPSKNSTASDSALSNPVLNSSEATSLRSTRAGTAGGREGGERREGGLGDVDLEEE